MTDTTSRFIVSADWLQERLTDQTVKIVDASWYLPQHNRNGKAEYEAGHIPGAVFFDQDEIADHTSGLPHTVPSPDVFAAHVGQMGISIDASIVVYDGPGLFSSARVWWLFRVMGATKVYVLDGGLDGWKAEGRPLTNEPTEPQATIFAPVFNADAITTFGEMRSTVETGSAQIADARGAGRFTGAEAEPRAGMRSGHMPGAKNLPIAALAENGRLKSIEALHETLLAAGIDLDRPVVTSCGSGVTAAVITLALQSVGHADNTLYDGSWAEWGSRDDTPVVTGKA
ncbi:3-mercaptopyruvate sulfurtransferase [Rhizobium sp. CFBP 8762]|uniref:3-mercaptopyruvate sulfurtransferase n=1 Tax=Rhizobium sp. CFBP 8762 TaxID=2775279 RepID=UPI001780DE09|nr:3-mercaptopyruvate sulfurtransferase [Rhizobium sp. CFBP 8762]MBD8555792.1 3-mercaptopyruvate sulfurtransferase [Rhizobium sp. CFBP 8762]